MTPWQADEESSLASSKQAYDGHVRGANWPASHEEFSQRCSSSMPLNQQRVSAVQDMGFERWSQPFSKYAPTALQTSLPEQSASPNTCRAPVCWQQNLSVLLSVSCWILFYIQRQDCDFLKQFFGNNKLNCFGDTHVFFGPKCKLHNLILHCQIFLAILITKKLQSNSQEQAQNRDWEMLLQSNCAGGFLGGCFLFVCFFQRGCQKISCFEVESIIQRVFNKKPHLCFVAL